MFTEPSSNSSPGGSTSNADHEPSRVPLAELADAACIATNGDTAEGGAQLFDVLTNDYPAFCRAKERELFSLFTQDQIRGSRHRLRSQLANPPKGRQTTVNQAVGSASLRSAAASWFGWPLLPGVMLGDAKRVHLQAMSKDYLRDADTFMKRGRWLDAIARALPDETSKVCDVLNEEVIGKMAAEFGVSV